MFDKYAEKLKKLEADVPKIFEKVAKDGAIKFVNEAKKRTDKEKLVDTSNYKRNWNAQAVEPMPETYGVQCNNSVEYASFLEYGYVLKKDVFIPFDEGSGISKKTGKHWKTKGMQGGPKTKEFIQKIKAKYPNAKGFKKKAGKYKGYFVGELAMGDARYYCIEELEKELEKAFRKQ